MPIFAKIVNMKQVEQIKIDELREMAERMYGDMVKAVVDIEQGLLVVDGEMHVDQENNSRSVEDAAIRDQITALIDSKVSS
jgi:hypothetical protein